MKKLKDLPIYFLIVGFALNIIIYFYNKVSFTELMIRTIVVIILFSVTGYILASVLSNAATAASKNNKKETNNSSKAEKTSSTIDITVSSEDDDELLKILPQSEKEDFVEINPENFKNFMDQE